MSPIFILAEEETTTTTSSKAAAILSATLGIMAAHKALDSEDDLIKMQEGYHRAHRTMSCPARLRVDDELDKTLPDRFYRHGSNFGITFADMRRDFVPTIKTLALLFLYLLMSSPLYISAAIYSNCVEAGDCHQLGIYVIIFYNLSMLGLVVYPYFWLLLDKQFSRKIIQVFRKNCENMRRKVTFVRHAFYWREN